MDNTVLLDFLHDGDFGGAEAVDLVDKAVYFTFPFCSVGGGVRGFGGEDFAHKGDKWL